MQPTLLMAIKCALVLLVKRGQDEEGLLMANGGLERECDQS